MQPLYASIAKAIISPPGEQMAKLSSGRTSALTDIEKGLLIGSGTWKPWELP